MLPLFLLYLIRTPVAALPNINLPINAQVPQIARPQQEYSFAFSESTFTSASTLSYSLSSAPQWLSLDGASRTLSGTPSTEDVGSIGVDLVAYDRDGSTHMPFTLVISSEAGPGSGLSVASQLPAYGAFSDPNRILLAPSNSLSISFSPNTFTNTEEKTVYYATTIDHTPLPSWLHFDPSTLSLKGTTPQATSPLDKTQTFGIQLSASNIVGFADATAVFDIVVESHLLAFRSTTLILTVTAGALVRDSAVARNLLLDGQVASQSQIKNVTASAPSWLHLDRSSLAMSGIAPADFKDQNFTVTVTDQYADSASVLVVLQSTGSPSASLLAPIGAANATMGTEFVYHLQQMLNASNAELSVDLGTASGWLEFDEGRSDIKGHVPVDLKPQQLVINITASLGDEMQSEILTIAVQDMKGSGTPAAQPPTSSGSGVDTGPPSTTATQPLGSDTRKPWIAAIIVPLAVLIPAAVLLGLHWQRRRRRPRRTYIGTAQEKEHQLPNTRHEDDARSAKRPTSRLSLPPILDLPFFSSTKRQSHPQPPEHSTRGRAHRSSAHRPTSAGLMSYFYQGPADFDAIVEEGCAGRAKGHTAPSVPLHTAVRSKSLKRRLEKSSARLSNPGGFYNQFMRGCGHGKLDPSRYPGNMQLGMRGSRSGSRSDGHGPPGFGSVHKSWRNGPTDSHSWRTVSDSSDQGTQHVDHPTLRAVKDSPASSRRSWVDPTADPTPLKIPEAARMRQPTNRFVSGGSYRGPRARRTRSRSSSLGTGMRRRSPSSPDRTHMYPKFLGMRKGPAEPLARSSVVSNPSRYQSVRNSEIGSVEFAFQDDLNEVDVRPGLSIAEHRQSSPLAEVPNRFTRMDPASDDKSSILGGEDEGEEDGARWMMTSRGERLGKQVSIGDARNRSLKGRIETSESFSTGKATAPRRSGSIALV